MTATLRLDADPARPALVVRRAPRATEAVYRRRRLLVGGIGALIAATAIVAAHDVLVDPGGAPASAATGQPARTSIVAQPGDTLWAIASARRGDVSMSDYLDKLVELNGGASIQAGQRIVIP